MDRELVSLGSGVGAGVLDAVLYMKLPAVLPGQSGPLLGIEPIPPLSYWINLGTSLGVLGVGQAMRNPTVKTAGEGMTLYSFPKLLQVAMSRAGAMLVAPAARQTTPPKITVTPGAARVKVDTGVRVVSNGRYKRA